MIETFVASAVAVVADLKSYTLQICNNNKTSLFGGGVASLIAVVAIFEGIGLQQATTRRFWAFSL